MDAAEKEEHAAITTEEDEPIPCIQRYIRDVETNASKTEPHQEDDCPEYDEEMDYSVHFFSNVSRPIPNNVTSSVFNTTDTSYDQNDSPILRTLSSTYATLSTSPYVAVFSTSDPPTDSFSDSTSSIYSTKIKTSSTTAIVTNAYRTIVFPTHYSVYTNRTTSLKTSHKPAVSSGHRAIVFPSVKAARRIVFPPLMGGHRARH